jgi:predicted RNase H-like nuclease (RuvC/YqgF family)
MKYICISHTEALKAVAEIQDWTNAAENTEWENITEGTITEWICFVREQAQLIQTAVDEAMYAGQRMENGLGRKQTRVEELEEEVKNLEAQIEGLEAEKYDLEGERGDLSYEVESLKSIISQLQN